jgi:IS30 family transposase
MKYKHPKTAHLPPTEEIVRMYQSGLSHSQIAEKLNTSTNAIQRRLRSVGVGRTRSEAAKNAYKQGRLKNNATGLERLCRRSLFGSGRRLLRAKKLFVEGRTVAQKVS